MNDGLNRILDPVLILAVTRPQSAIRDPKSQGACSSVWLERTPDKREVDGSTPSRPTNRFGGVAQLGERLPCTQEAIGSNPFTSTTILETMWEDRTVTLFLTSEWPLNRAFKPCHHQPIR